MHGSEPVRHRLASRGLQDNFADDEKMVTILDVATGAVVSAREGIESNLVEDNFNSVVTPASVRNDELEQPWAGIGSAALELAGAVSPANAEEYDTRAAVCGVFAVHVVRSHAYLEAHRPIVEHGDDSWFVDSMARVYDEIVTWFATRHLQVITSPPELPGFVLSDVPFVHIDSQTGRYGYRDGLAVDDADLIVAPLTRRTVVCLTAEPMDHFALTTKKATQLINAALGRSGRELVASHPDDAREARRVFAHLDDLPVAKLLA